MVAGADDRILEDALNRQALDNRDSGVSRNDAVQSPARGGEEIAELLFGALVAAGEDKHLEIEEFAGIEVISGLNYLIDHQQLAAGIHTGAAAAQDLEA